MNLINILDQEQHRREQHAQLMHEWKLYEEDFTVKRLKATREQLNYLPDLTDFGYIKEEMIKHSNLLEYMYVKKMYPLVDAFKNDYEKYKELINREIA